MRLSALLLVGGLFSCVSAREAITPDEFHLGYTRGGFDSTGSLGGTSDPWRFMSAQDGDFDAITAGLTWHIGASASAAKQDDLLREMRRTNALLAAQLAAPVSHGPEEIPAPPEPGEAIPTDTRSAGAALPSPGERTGERHAERQESTISRVTLAGDPSQPLIATPVAVELKLPAVLENFLLAALVEAPGSEEAPAPAPASADTGADISITVQGGSSQADASGDRTEAAPSPSGAANSPTSGTPESHGGSTEPQGVMLLGISTEVWTQLFIGLTALAGAVATYLGRNKIPVLKDHTKKGKAEKAAREGKPEPE